MTNTTAGAHPWPARHSDEQYAYLITTGRRTGRPHRVEIWFGVEDGRIYLLSGGRDRSDWVRNIKADPRVTIELGGETRSGTARIVPAGSTEDQLARELLVGKYQEGNNLERWGRTALAVELSAAD